jgi:uncharacterized tellurite resistance protein B-like protein
MAEPFKTQPLEAASFIGGLIGRKPRRNGLIAVTNLLADAPCVEDVSVHEADLAAAAWGLKLGSRYRNARLQIASDFLNFCLADRRLDDVELDRLRHIRRILRLRRADVNEIKSRAVRAVYSKSVEEVLADHYLDEEERDFLDRMADNLGVPEEVADRIYSTQAQAIMQGALDEAIEDERLSPDEDAELAALAANLGVSISEDDETRHVLDRFRTYWQLEEAPLPEIEVDINLQSGEYCYLRTEADWLEHRKVTNRVGYSGPTVRLKIVEGVYWRAGNMGVARATEDVMKRIDSGTCYITNKRVLFRGEHGNKTIPLGRILAVESYSNGVEIEKDRGKTPFLSFKHGTDIFGLMLDRLIDEEG